jgi:hypothetical protein
MARASHPLGLINAGDPVRAADDTFEVGKVYAREASFALRWAALYNAAIAEACQPESTIESVLGVARRVAGYRAASLYAPYDTLERELRTALDLAAEHQEPLALREAFAAHYSGGGHVTYGMSQANEIVCKGLALFAVTRGDPDAAIPAAVNFGRDTDCLAAVSGGLAGAFAGVEAVRPEWITQVNEATGLDPYTNSRRTIEETADSLLTAFGARQQRLHGYLQTMAEADGPR